MDRFSPFQQAAIQKSKDDCLGDPAFTALVIDYGARADALLKKVGSAKLANNKRDLRQAINAVLNSYAAMVTSLVCSLPAKHRRTPQDILNVAGQLTPFRDCGEPIERHNEPKASGKGFRPITKFRWRRRALQRLCREIINAMFGPDPSDLMAPGKGTEVASDWMRQRLLDGGRFVVLADLKDFYTNINREEVTRLLGLPRSVVENCIFVPSTTTVTTTATEDLSYPVPLDGASLMGLPQGSLVSPMIAGLLLGPSLRAFAGDRFGTHGDDIAIVACTWAEAKAMQKALVESLKTHPAGPFRLKHCYIMTASDGFDWLKYRFKLINSAAVSRDVSRMSYRRFKEKAAKLVLKEAMPDDLKIIQNYERNWCKSFRRKMFPMKQIVDIRIKLDTILTHARTIKSDTSDKKAMARARKGLRNAVTR